MKPVFLGDGDATQYSNPDYWRNRVDYWTNAANKYTTEWRKEHAQSVALGFQMLLDGRAKQLGDGRVEYETEETT